MPTKKRIKSSASMKSRVRKWMRNEAQILGDDLNMTKLAENAAHAFEKDEWLDDPDHWIWEMAADYYDE